MTNFSQEGQQVSGDQYNADQIIIQQVGISFEQYKSDLAAKEKEIRALLIDQTRTEEQSKLLRAELAEVEHRRAD